MKFMTSVVVAKPLAYTAVAVKWLPSLTVVPYVTIWALPQSQSFGWQRPNTCTVICPPAARVTFTRVMPLVVTLLFTQVPVMSAGAASARCGAISAPRLRVARASAVRERGAVAVRVRVVMIGSPVGRERGG